MTEQGRKARNQKCILEMWPPMQPKIAAIIQDMEAHGWKPRIQCAYRTPSEQAACMKAGYTRVDWSFHCATGKDGSKQSLAADIVNDTCPYKEPDQFKRDLASSAAAHGLMTGINWSRPYDPWHVQPRGITTDAARAGKRPDFG